ncbi:MAG: MFS transporter [Candidatus Thermoplasmatota archaeon]|nr:MFS transporter [Candidatus Thermoplasmatota archaeon]MCL5987709.1 MFS transporter [Candidatus Thermoplasmatota archaeon]
MKSLGRSSSITLMMILRALYAMNWYNVSPLLPDILGTYGTPLYLGGFMLFAFLIGTAIFQVPSGIIAARIGSKNTAMTGMILMSISAALSVFSPDFTAFLFTRFLVGVGSAFFFSSGVGVLNDIDKEHSKTNIAIFNTSFSVGGGIGIVIFQLLSSTNSWQMLMIYSGIVTLVFSIIGSIWIPSARIAGNQAEFTKNVKERFFSKPLLLLSLALSGYWGTNFTFGEYEVNYAKYIGFAAGTAGIIGSLALFAGILGLLLYRRIRIGSPSILLPSLLVSISIVIATQALGFPYELFFVSAFAGAISIMLFSLEYYYVILLEKEEKYVPLSISIMNGIQIATGSLIAAVFGYLYAFSPELSWLFLPAVSLAMFPLGINTIRKIKAT